MTTPVAPAAPPPAVSFELAPTAGEHLRALRMARRNGHARARQLRLVQQVTAVVTGALALGIFFLYRGGSLDTMHWVLAGALVAFCLSPLFTLSQVRSKRRAGEPPSRVTLTESGVEATDARGSSTVPWTAVRDVVETDEFLLFDLGVAGGFFVPLRVLREAATLERVRALIVWARQAAVRAQDAPPPDLQGPAFAVEFATTLRDDFAAAIQVYFRSRQGRVTTGGTIGSFVSLWVLFRLLGPVSARDTLYLLVTPILFVLILVPGLVLVSLALGQRRVRGDPVPRRIVLDDAGLTYSIGGVSETEPWAAIRRVQQAGGLLLFWIGGGHVRYLPLRVLSAAGAEEARRIIRRHAGERAVL
ncbi:MAG TPA: YcxB family protein [Longimicrobium sp.]|nr:YcxB family protein [Longimicrobium sp.]